MRWLKPVNRTFLYRFRILSSTFDFRVASSSCFNEANARSFSSRTSAVKVSRLSNRSTSRSYLSGKQLPQNTRFFSFVCDTLFGASGRFSFRGRRLTSFGFDSAPILRRGRRGIVKKLVSRQFPQV
jgi:hypothetical protein